MGMPISVDIPHATDASLHEVVFEVFKDIDQRFSTYKPQSEVSRLRRGERTHVVSTDMQAVIDACRVFESQTHGYFSAYYDGSFDPSGYTKALALKRAKNELTQRDCPRYMINAGGDITCVSDAEPWVIAIQDPSDGTATIGELSAPHIAIATSGTYVRGDHIIDPHTQLPATAFLSVSVWGLDIIEADVYATAIQAGGTHAIKLLEGTARLKGMYVLRDGSRHTFAL